MKRTQSKKWMTHWIGWKSKKSGVVVLGGSTTPYYIKERVKGYERTNEFLFR